MACATSTGGITGKREGRVGDSPLVGSGGYADNNIGAVSTTGRHQISIMMIKISIITIIIDYSCEVPKKLNLKHKT